MLPKSLTSPMSDFNFSLLRRKSFALSAAWLFPTWYKAKPTMPPTNNTTSKPSTTTTAPIIKTIFFVVMSERSAMEVETAKIVDERCIEEQAIESIEYAAMTGQNVRGVLCSGAALERAFREIAKDSYHRHDHCQRQDVFQWEFTKEPEMG